MKETSPRAAAAPSEAASRSKGPSQALPARTLTISNRRGLHARAAAKFVKTCEGFTAVIAVEKDGQEVGGLSIMGLMMLGAHPGSTIEVSADGPDAEAALDALQALVEAGFHETD